MRPVTQTRTLAAAASAAIIAAQAPAANTPLTINGSLAAGGVATMAAQQTLGFTSAGNLSGMTFTITGTNDSGGIISETLTGPNGNTVNTQLNYRTVTKIVPSGTSATTLTVDTLQVGASQEVPVDVYQNPTNITLAVEVTGVVNYTVQWTVDDVFGGQPGPFTWVAAAANLTGATTNQVGTLVSPVRAVRVLTNSGGGTAKFIVNQGGVMG